MIDQNINNNNDDFTNELEALFENDNPHSRDIQAEACHRLIANTAK